MSQSRLLYKVENVLKRREKFEKTSIVKQHHLPNCQLNDYW